MHMGLLLVLLDRDGIQATYLNYYAHNMNVPALVFNSMTLDARK